MKNPRITNQEIEIIKKAQAGDISAFNKLFDHYKNFVDNLLFKYIKDTDESKDITNIVFLKVYNNLSKFTDYSSFGGWLRILANRTAIDYLRSIENKPRATGTVEDRLSLATNVSSDEIDLVNRLSYERVLEEFDKFPSHMKKILEMFYINNLTVSQISEKLSIPTGTIKSILSRTRKIIKQNFKQF